MMSIFLFSFYSTLLRTGSESTKKKEFKSRIRILWKKNYRITNSNPWGKKLINYEFNSLGRRKKRIQITNPKKFVIKIFQVPNPTSKKEFVFRNFWFFFYKITNPLRKRGFRENHCFERKKSNEGRGYLKFWLFFKEMKKYNGAKKKN